MWNGGLVGDHKESVLNLLLGWLDAGDAGGVAVRFQPQQNEEMFLKLELTKKKKNQVGYSVMGRFYGK